MNDKELLKLAAKAAGMGPTLCYEIALNCLRLGVRTKCAMWHPLTDDGDALRLAVKLSLSIIHSVDGGAMVMSHDASISLEDQCTRRAIVRAAAEIGKEMP